MYVLYRSCRFEQNILVTGIFFRTALGNQFLGGEQILVTVVCSKCSIVKKQHKVLISGSTCIFRLAVLDYINNYLYLYVPSNCYLWGTHWSNHLFMPTLLLILFLEMHACEI